MNGGVALFLKFQTARIYKDSIAMANSTGKTVATSFVALYCDLGVESIVKGATEHSRTIVDKAAIPDFGL
jgi:hypothetical protein